MDLWLRKMQRHSSNPEHLAHLQCRLENHAPQATQLILSDNIAHYSLDMLSCQCGKKLWQGTELCDLGHHRYTFDTWINSFYCIRCGYTLFSKAACSQGLHRWDQRKDHKKCLLCQKTENSPCKHERLRYTPSKSLNPARLCFDCCYRIRGLELCNLGICKTHPLVQYSSDNICSVLGCKNSHGKDIYDLDLNRGSLIGTGAVRVDEHSQVHWRARRKWVWSSKGRGRSGKLLLSYREKETSDWEEWKPATRKHLKELQGGWFVGSYYTKTKEN